jgi:acyl-CoA thioesterase
MNHCFAELIGLELEEQLEGSSKCSLEADEKLFNPHKVIHGAAIYSLADTGMGAALYPALAVNESCATLEIKINYFRPITSGTISCVTEMVNKGKSIANLESSIYNQGKLAAKANGNYAIFKIASKKSESDNA